MYSNILARAVAVAVTTSVVAFAGISGAQADEKTPYTVIDGKVDKGTYNGYRRYASTCHVCHGPDGLGSTFAPALAESLKTMSYDDFVNTVTSGRQSNVGGVLRVMPSWANNPDVMNYIDDIYGYLKARADGKIGTGRPTRIGE
jgi:methanol metabolism-related c-type cytochrome